MNNTEIIKKALIEIRELKSKFKKLQNQQTEPIAIIGMGCRFPGGADNLDSYWNLLHNGIDAISHVPEDRWNKDELYDSDPDTKGKINNTFGGFLKSSIYDFDPRFFNISVQEAIQIDPQQRLLLEVVWETLENSNISPDDLFESLTGVFVGLSSFDYALRIFGSNEREQISPYSGSGALLSPPAGRISYLLGLKGPCMSVDTACSSASLAIHLASQSLRNRECNLALAGGINALLSPGMSIYFSTAGMLSSDGRCKTFDAAANGYVRSEGCGMIALKRLSDAEADNDTIYAIIKGSAVNQDGPGAGLTVPNGPSQEIVIKKALSFAQIKPDQVSYIEAHGTGTALGDPIEMRALSKVYCNNRSKDNTLWVGSVKTNLGHMEPAAGMASIIKIVLSMQHNEIPKNLHFRNPNPLIPFDEYPIKVPQKNVPWFSKENPRIAASSAFGFSGTNVHILVQEWPSIKTNTNIQNDRPVHLFVLSAKTNAALEQLAERYASHLSGFDDHSISNICFTANTCRKHFDKRMSIIAETTGQLISLLNSFLDGNISSPQLFTEHNFEPIDPFKEEWFEGIYDGQQNWNKAFSNIAKYYVNGGTINFKQLDQSYTRQKVNLPLYPFQRKRYEVKLQERGIINENNNHPLIGKRLMSPALKNSIVFESIYSENTQFLKEHVIFNKMISPAAAHLSKVCSSVHEALGTSQLTVEDITFQIPLVVDNHQKKRVQIILEKQIDTPMPFQIISADQGTDDNWTVHCDGSVAAINTSGSTVISFDDIKNRCKHFKKGKEFYQDFINAGYELGPNYQRIVESYYGDGEAVCKLMLSSENTDQYIHPGLMDSIFQSGMFASLQTLKKIISSDTIYIPAYIKSFTLYSRDFSQTIWTHAQTKTNDHSLETDITGINENGKLLFKVNRLLVKETDKKVLYKAISNQKELYYSIDWQENNLPETAHKQSCLYLIFADHNSPSSNRLFEYVKQHSLHYVMVFKSPEFKHINHRFEINPESKDHFNTLIKTITESNPTIPIQILYMWGFDLALTDTDRTNVLKEIIEHSCKSLLNLIQLMVNYEWNTFPQLWVLTNNACQTGDTSTPIEISQSSLLGMGKIMALEHPELWGGNIDIQMSEQSIETLFNEMSLDEHINDPVAIRNNGKSYSAKLKEIRLNKQTSPIIIKPNATYLITGGLGSLGLITAKWLIDKGAKHILLSGRKGPGPDIKEKIVLMTKDDVHIDTQQLDVSDFSSISNAFEHIKQTMPPLKGIIHSAGVLDDGAITFQNWERFHKVIAPKIYGAWNLHTLTQTMDIDFFILFSSVVSTMGNPGQSNYAAANAFLDGLAHYRKSKQLPVTCINWGPWDTEGMAGGNETIRDIFHANGFQLINPESGIDALDRIVSEKLTQIAVINCQFKKFLDQNSVKKYGFYSLLTDVQLHMTLPDPLKKPEKSALFLKLEAASSDERLDILEHYIKNKIVQLMGLDSVDEVDSRKRLFDLGIDSLMAVELRNHFKAILGIPLSSTLLFDYPTIEALLHYLIEALNFETQEEITQPETLESNQRMNIENLSEDEAEKLLLEALEMSDDL